MDSLASARLIFDNSAEDYKRFKLTVIGALDEYLNSGDSIEVAQCIKEEEKSIFYPEVTSITIKHSFNKTDEQRKKYLLLLSLLVKTEKLLSPINVERGIRKIFHQIGELTIDIPFAPQLLIDTVQYLVDHECTVKDSTILEDTKSFISSSSDPVLLAKIKQSSEKISLEYFLHEVIEEASKSFDELKCPSLQYEMIKKCISLSFDRSNKERELTSKLLSYLHTNGIIDSTHIERAFSILLERVEDLYIDIPNILLLLSLFISRCITDGVLSPTFVNRQDLSVNDLGSQVLKECQRMLSEERPNEKMTNCWKQKEKEKEKETLQNSKEKEIIHRKATK